MDKPKHFYPIFVEHDSATIVNVGEPLELETDRRTVSVDPGIDIVWPMRTDGSEGRWQLKRETFIVALEEGTAKLGTYNKRQKRWAINYLNQGIKDEIAKGAIKVEGKDEKGALILKRITKKLVEPKSVWNQSSHNASEYGTTLLNAIIGSERFSYPKSLYAVKDTIDMCVHDKPEALIVDFFAGSGTTLHAVNLLNAETNGRRRCIMVTNNEVSAEASDRLSQKGCKPGDDEWEKYGIARNATWPRTVCSIEGHDIDGNALVGDYLGGLGSMADGFKSNAAFFKLSFLDKTSVALGRQFRELLPVLWMKGGAIGKCPALENDNLPNMLILPQNKMAVLVDEIYYSEFDAGLSQHPEIQTVFIITDSETAYRSIIRTYDGKDCYQLYRDYLDNFGINTGR